MTKRFRTMVILLILLLMSNKTYAAKSFSAAPKKPVSYKTLKKKLKRVYESCDVGSCSYRPLLRNVHDALLVAAGTTGFSEEILVEIIIMGLPYENICSWLSEKDCKYIHRAVAKFLASWEEKKLKLKSVKRFIFNFLMYLLPDKQKHWEVMQDESSSLETTAFLTNVSNPFAVLSLDDEEK